MNLHAFFEEDEAKSWLAGPKCAGSKSLADLILAPPLSGVNPLEPSFPVVGANHLHDQFLIALSLM